MELLYKGVFVKADRDGRRRVLECATLEGGRRIWRETITQDPLKVKDDQHPFTTLISQFYGVNENCTMPTEADAIAYALENSATIN